MRKALPLVALLLLLSCSGKSPTAHAPPAPSHRLLVVGWDGASFREIDRLRGEGRLPHLSALMERGVAARLDSTIIPISSAAWTSAVTGRSPGATGVFSFFEPVEGGYDVRLISARSNHAPPIWRLLTARGLRSTIVGVPITYPPEPILGTMVAGMLSPFDADYTWPPGLAANLRARGFVPDLDTWVEARPVGLEEFESQLRIKEDVLRELIGRDDWSYAMVVFKSLDVLSHLSYGVDFDQSVGPLYERLDEQLGKLVELVGEDTNVILLSDHGFRVYSSGLNLHAWLLSEGFSVREESFKRFNVRDDMPLGQRERLEIRLMRSQLDWSETRAFATRCEGNFGSIRLNLEVREAQGIVEEGDREELLGELETRLRAYRDKVGTPAVVRTWRTRDLYPGPFADTLPDLLFETAPGCQVFTDPGEEQIAGNYDQGLPDHERTGIFIGAGPSFRRIAARADAGISDLAPTALYLLEQSVPEGMTGEVLTRFLDEERAVETIPDRSDPVREFRPDGDKAPFTELELIAIEKRLRGLGYGR